MKDRISLTEVFVFYFEKRYLFLVVLLAVTVCVAFFSSLTKQESHYETVLEVGSKGLGLSFESTAELSSLISSVYIPLACKELNINDACPILNVSFIGGGAYAILRTNKNRYPRRIIEVYHRGISERIVAHHNNILNSVKAMAGNTISKGRLESAKLAKKTDLVSLEKLRKWQSSVAANQQQINFIRPTRVLLTAQEGSNNKKMSAALSWGLAFFIGLMIAVVIVPLMLGVKAAVKNKKYVERVCD